MKASGASSLKVAIHDESMVLWCFCNVFVFCAIRVQDPVKSTLFFIIQINLI